MKLRSEELVKPEVIKLPSDDTEHPFEVIAFDEMLKRDVPKVKKLIGGLISSEEQVLFFGPSTVGKSALGIAFAKAISEGEDLDMGNGVVLENEHAPMKVVYFDFEQSISQNQARYKSDLMESYPRLLWARIERYKNLPNTPEGIFETLKNCSLQNESKCIIIDNISKIGRGLEKTDNADLFMELMWKLVKNEGFTIIIISHTIKGLKSNEILEGSHLRGSGNMFNLSDTVVGIKMTPNKGEAYIKQFKTKTGEIIYGSDNVIVTKLEKENGVLKHTAKGYSNELDLLFGESTINTVKAPDREFYAMANIYYGSSREANYKLNKIGLQLSHTAINGHYNELKKLYPEKASFYEAMDRDELKEQLDFKSPNQNEFLPYADDHTQETEIPF